MRVRGAIFNNYVCLNVGGGTRRLRDIAPPHPLALRVISRDLIN